MIISHKYRYLFIELPHTGTRAINKELIQLYNGERILSHHSNLYDFLRIATKDETRYFVFSGLRNPLDLTVSQYFKYRSIAADQNVASKYKSGNRRKARRFHEIVFDSRLRRHLTYLRDPDISFSDYFRDFYKWPYDNWASVCHDQCDFIIRFESLQEDYSRVLEKLGIEQVRPLPRKGRTAGRRGHYSSFYREEVRHQAVNVFGPCMERWGYEFPEAWRDIAPNAASRKLYAFLSIFRHSYWRYLRPYL